MKLFRKKSRSRLTKLPSGAFTLDRNGRVVVSTLPRSFSETQMRDIGEHVLAFFRGAHSTQMPLQELNIYYANLKVTARDLRGGAIIFLTPHTFDKIQPLSL